MNDANRGGLSQKTDAKVSRKHLFAKAFVKVVVALTLVLGFLQETRFGLRLCAAAVREAKHDCAELMDAARELKHELSTW